MGQRKSDSGFARGGEFKELRDVNVPDDHIADAQLTVSASGEVGVLDYSQDYFTAKALEVIPPMSAVKVGPGGVLPKTSAQEPDSPVIGVSVLGAAAGAKCVVLKSGKIGGKVFTPANALLRVLPDGTVGTGAAGTPVGTVDGDGVGYVSIGSASAGGGSAEFPKDGGAGSVLLKTNDATGDVAWGAFPEKLTTLRAGDIRVYHKDHVPSWALALKSTEQSVTAGTYPELDALLGTTQPAPTSFVPMTSNTAPAPYTAKASSNATTAWKAFATSLNATTYWASTSGFEHSAELTTTDGSTFALGTRDMEVLAVFSAVCTFTVRVYAVINGEEVLLKDFGSKTSNAFNDNIRGKVPKQYLRNAGESGIEFTLPMSTYRVVLTVTSPSAVSVTTLKVINSPVPAVIVGYDTMTLPAGSTYGDFVECIVHTTTQMNQTVAGAQVGEVFMFPKNALPANVLQLTAPLTITEADYKELYTKFSGTYTPSGGKLTIPAPAIPASDYLVPAIVAFPAVGASSGGSVSISEKEGNIIVQETDGLYAAQEVSDASSNLAMLAGDGIFVPGEAIVRAVGDIIEMPAGIKDPALLPMSSYHTVLRDDTTKVVEDLYGNWWFAYAEEELLVELPAMTSNTEPAPLVAATSSILAATTQPYIAFDKVTGGSSFWHTQNAANQWISLDFGKEMAIRSFAWVTRMANSPDITPNTVTVTCTNSNGDSVFTGDYTGFNHAEGQSATFQLKPGTTTPVNATVGVIKNVRKITILNKQSMYTGAAEIPLVVYDNDKMPDIATHFVTEKRPHAVKGMEYYLVIKPWADKTTPIVLSAETGNTLRKKPDGLYSAGAKISDDDGNTIEAREDGLFVQALGRYLEPGEIYVGRKGLQHPNIISMSNYNILKKDDNPDVLAAFGNWWYKYLQEEALYKLPPMTSNTAPAPLVAAASSVHSGASAWYAFDQAAAETVWHSSQGANQWISLDLGKEYAMQQFSWWNRSYNAPVGNPTSAVLTLWDDSDAVVLQKTYTGFSTASLGKADIPLLPGTTTDKDATIGVVKNVRKFRIQVPANQYVIAKEIPVILYENDKVPDLATEFVTPKRIYPTDYKEYFIVLKAIKVLPDGTIANGVKDVTISPDTGNVAEMRGNGLFVPASGGGGSVVVSPDAGNAIEQRANGLFAAGAQIPDIQVNTVTKMPYKLNGKQVYAFKMNPFVGPASNTLYALPAAMPAFDAAWIDPATSYYMRNTHSTTLADTLPISGTTWYTGVQIPERKVSIICSSTMATFTAHLTILFTTPSGE